MNHKITKAMILAAGEGTRLRPLTLTVPKAMVPVGGTPLIEYIICWLKKYSIADIGINLFYLGDKIVGYLGDGSRLGVNITYSWEEKIIGTAGGLKKLERFFKDGPFVLVYGDVLTDFNLNGMTEFHKHKKAIATIALTRVSDPHECGIVEVSDEGRIKRFVEKPPPGTEKSDLANAGVYILETEIFDHISETGFCDFAFDVFPRLLKENISVYGYKIQPGEYLIDIGSNEKYEKANEDHSVISL